MLPEAKPFSIFGVPVTVVLAVLIFSAVLAGGATERMTQGLVLAAMGTLMIAAPPAAWPDRKWSAVVLALLAFSALGLLPAAWFRPAAWRAHFAAAGIELPATLSPQPRLTLEAWLLLAAGVAWMGWLLALPCDAGSRRRGARWFAGGAVVLAVLALVQWKTGWRPPGWLSEEGHGPFPNRNHTAHVLALGGVLAVGCAADASARSRLRAVPWILAACVVLAALAATYSRGGIVMFFSALAIWNASLAWQRKSWKILLLGLSALCLAAAAILVFGGPIAARFAGGAGSGTDFRFRIWNDAGGMIDASPLHGAGLGNFSGVFPFYRVESVIQSRVIHPESDWMWLAAETGIVGAALAMAALAIAFAGVAPLRRGTQRSLRRAAMAASAAALVHGFLDVPGHRLGSVLAALFVLMLARGNRAADSAPSVSRGAVAMWRALGLAMVALAAWWIHFTDDAARAEVLARERRFPAAAECASRAIARAPLDWRPYFTRAGALAHSGKILAAVADFRRARVLEPHFAAIPFEEGKFWARLQPELALAAWDETMRRATGPEAVGIFGQIVMSAPDDATFRARLLGIVAGREMLEMDWFLSVPIAEARPHLAAMSRVAEHSDQARSTAFARRVAELGAALPQ